MHIQDIYFKYPTGSDAILRPWHWPRAADILHDDHTTLQVIWTATPIPYPWTKGLLRLLKLLGCSKRDLEKGYKSTTWGAIKRCGNLFLQEGAKCEAPKIASQASSPPRAVKHLKTANHEASKTANQLTGNLDATYPSAGRDYLQPAEAGNFTSKRAASSSSSSSSSSSPPLGCVSRSGPGGTSEDELHLRYRKEARRYKRYGPPPVTPGRYAHEFCNKARLFVKAERDSRRKQERALPPQQLEIWRLAG